MANTTVSTANQVQVWRKKFFSEYIRANRFSKYMGADENSVFQVTEDLTMKPGKSVTCTLFTRLTGNGVTGNSNLEGNEEALDNYGHEISIDQYRNAVVIQDFEQQKSEQDLMNAGRRSNMNWAMEHLRDKIVTALHSINGVAYASASEAQKDAWVADNSDRVLFGAAVGNYSASDHSASLGNVDSTNDTLDAGMVSLAKRIAMDASPHIKPIRTNDDEEWYVMFAPTRAFRDLKNDSTIQQANREAWQRGKDNPIFRAGDIIYDGVVVREVPEIGYLTGVGNGSIDVAPCFLCGAQSVGIAYAKRPEPIRDTRDYGDKKGTGVRVWYGVDKLQFVDSTNADIDHGVVTVYASGVADS